MYDYKNFEGRALESMTQAEITQANFQNMYYNNAWRADALAHTAFKGEEFVIDKILPYGIFLLAGAPKIGKSFMALDMGAAVARGVPFLGFDTIQGDVLYLALEDTQRRLSKRLNKCFGDEVDNLQHLYLYNETAGLNEHYGLLLELDNHMAKYPDTKLIIIDTLEYIRPKQGRSHIMYTDDSNVINTLRLFTNKHDVALVLVHHTRKMGDVDPMNTILGSNGLSGTTDGSWVLQKPDRSNKRGLLYFSARDVEVPRLDLEFNPENCRWTSNGIYDNEEYDIKKDPNFALCEVISQFVNFCEEPWDSTVAELCDVLNETNLNVYLKLTPSVLARRLTAVARSLAQDYGIEVSLRTGKANKRYVSLHRVSKEDEGA